MSYSALDRLFAISMAVTQGLLVWASMRYVALAPAWAAVGVFLIVAHVWLVGFWPKSVSQ